MLKTLLKFLPLRVRPAIKAPYNYSEDLFADTRMSFGEHIEDLRRHLIRAILGFVIGLAIGLTFGVPILKYITYPVNQALIRYHEKYAEMYPDRGNAVIEDVLQQLNADAALRQEQPDLPPHRLAFLNKPREQAVEIRKRDLDGLLRGLYPKAFEKGGPLHDAPVAPEDATMTLNMQVKPIDFIQNLGPAGSLVGKRSSLTNLGVPETFMIYMLVAIITGLVISGPWIIYHIWAFVAAGLYPHERKYVTYYLPFSIFFFVAGIAICQSVIIPAALKYLVEFNLWFGGQIDPDPRLSEWLGLAIFLPLLMGISFQLPLVMLFMTKIGVFTPEAYRAKRKIAIFMIAIFSAVASPGDAPTMLLFMAPLVFLYELGVWMAKWSYQPPSDNWQEHEEIYKPES